MQTQVAPQAVVGTQVTEIVGLFLERIDDFDAIDIRAVVHVFREQLAHTRIDAGGQEQAVPMRQGVSLEEFEGVVKDLWTWRFDREDGAEAVDVVHRDVGGDPFLGGPIAELGRRFAQDLPGKNGLV